MVKNDKKFCSLCSICQKPYSMWLSFLVHKHKTVIPPGIFFIFPKFWFSRLLGVYRCFFLFVTFHISWAIIVICWTQVENDDISRWFFFFVCFLFIFSKFWFFLVSGVKGQKVSQNYKKCLSFALHFSGTTHMIFSYGTQV